MNRKTPIPRILFVLHPTEAQDQPPLKLESLLLLLQDFAHVETRVLADSPQSDPLLLELLQNTPFDLLLAPLSSTHRWLKLQSTSTAIHRACQKWASYFTQLPQDRAAYGTLAGPPQDSTVILDFARTTALEQLPWIQLLVTSGLPEHGLRLFVSEAPVFQATFSSSASSDAASLLSGSLGTQIDHLFMKSEVAQSPIWSPRLIPLQITLTALWGLIHQHQQKSASHSLNLEKTSALGCSAHLQVSLNANHFLFCLTLTLSSKDTYSELIKQLTVAQAAQQSSWDPASILMRVSDWIRILRFEPKNQIQLWVGFLPSAPAEKQGPPLGTFWIESITPLRTPLTTPSNEEESKASQPFQVHDFHQFKTRSLKKRIKKNLSSEDKKELSSLLDTLQKRYFDAKSQLRTFEIELFQLKDEDPLGQKTQARIKELRLKIEALKSRESAWMRKLATALHKLKRMKKSP
ncbi:MAG: hypothetical protein ACO3A2_08225 [Bdellovibrionia bacterium]